MTTEPGWALLATAVRRRRDRLGITQEEVGARGGPSTATLRGIESGTGESFRPKTLYALDAALEWERGTSIALVEGEVPPEYFLSFDEYVQTTIKDVRRKVLAGEDFAVQEPTRVEDRRRASVASINIAPRHLTNDELAEAARALLDELVRRVDPRRPTESHAFDAPQEYDLAARRGVPERGVEG